MNFRSTTNTLLRAAVLAWPLALAGCQAKLAAVDEAAPKEREHATQQSRDEVMTELQSYYRDLSARRWNAFASHFWPGATITTVWQPPGQDRQRVYVQTVPEFVAQTSEGPDSKPIFSEKLLDADITVQGHLAQAWARHEAEFGEPGNVAQWTGTDALTLMRFDGRWRIVSLAFAP